MKRAIAGTFVGLGLMIAMSLPAMAKPAKATASRARHKSAKTINFGIGDTLTGTLIAPNQALINARTFASHTSLIKVRESFIKEIVKSAHDL